VVQVTDASVQAIVEMVVRLGDVGFGDELCCG
jgi:hypothetical protein